VPTTQCKQIRFGFHSQPPIFVVADAPSTSSDGGLLLLRQADQNLGLCDGFAASLPDFRNAGRVIHSRVEQVRQRVFQIALGYEDCNDADSLRHDALLKTTCGRLPDDADGLSSQPVLSRFENDIDGKSINSLCALFERSYVDSLAADTTLVVLDIDTTDDPTHGGQQLTFFHGFYDQHMYHPLLVFDGQSGQAVTALLRPGNAHAARSATIILRRVIRRIKARFPEAQVLVRGDSGFCVPRVLDALEQLNQELNDIHYVLGIAKNSRLLALGQGAMAAAADRYTNTRKHVRHFTSFAYAAESWQRPRHIVMKAEHHEKGANPRFVVTTLEGIDPQMIYDCVYCARGQCENYIKDLKNALNADRLSCCSFKANFLRLLLHLAAYRLMFAVRRAAGTASPEFATAQFDTLRLRLLKVAANVKRSVRRILVRLPAAFPHAAAFAGTACVLGAQVPG
jgi:hypothetical protein